MWVVAVDLASTEIKLFHLHRKLYWTLLDWMIKEINQFLNSTGIRFFQYVFNFSTLLEYRHGSNKHIARLVSNLGGELSVYRRVYQAAWAGVEGRCHAKYIYIYLVYICLNWTVCLEDADIRSMKFFFCEAEILANGRGQNIRLGADQEES